MGLDAVEFVMRCEETFGIDISDEAAERMRTPRDVIDYVMTQVRVSEHPVCLSQHAFHKLRGAFTRTLHINRAAFRPRERIEDFVPEEGRRAMWAQLNTDLRGIKLFGLERPAWLAALLTTLSIGAWILPAMLLSQGVIEFTKHFLAGFLYAVAVAAVGLYATRSFMYVIPARYTYVGDMVGYVVANSVHAFKDEGLTREQVAKAVREITLDELGIDAGLYCEDARFLEDLGMD